MDIYEEIVGLRNDIASLNTVLSELVKVANIIEATVLCEVYEDKKKFLNAREAAVYLEVSDSSFHRCKERIPFVRKGKRLMYKVEDLDNYIKQNTVNSNKNIDFTKSPKARFYATA
jgi:hypothetical protein